MATLGVAAVALVLLTGGGRRRAARGVLADTVRPFPSASALDTAAAESAAAAGPDSAQPNAVLDSIAALSPAVGAVAAADSAAGDSIYHGRGRCFTCHGGRGAGLPNLGPDLRDAEWLHGDGSLRFVQATVLAGIAAPQRAPIGMPSFANVLSEGDAFRVAAYIYSLSHPGATVADSARATIRDTLR